MAISKELRLSMRGFCMPGAPPRSLSWGRIAAATLSITSGQGKRSGGPGMASIPSNRSRDGTFVRQSVEDYVVGWTERRLKKQAAVLVRRHILAIAMVADALRIETTLTGEDVRAFIEDAAPWGL
jgi:hypothetical protein